MAGKSGPTRTARSRLPSSIALFAPSFQEGTAFVICGTAVSYTHLDVYKRQSLYYSLRVDELTTVNSDLIQELNQI